MLTPWGPGCEPVLELGIYGCCASVRRLLNPGKGAGECPGWGGGATLHPYSE